MSSSVDGCLPVKWLLDDAYESSGEIGKDADAYRVALNLNSARRVTGNQ